MQLGLGLSMVWENSEVVLDTSNNQNTLEDSLSLGIQTTHEKDAPQQENYFDSPREL